MTTALPKAVTATNEPVDEQVLEQVTSCLEDVKLDLEELRQYSSSVMVAQGVELIHGLTAERDSLRAELDAAKAGGSYEHGQRVMLMVQLTAANSLLQRLVEDGENGDGHCYWCAAEEKFKHLPDCLIAASRSHLEGKKEA